MRAALALALLAAAHAPAAAVPSALVWIPPERYAQWSELDDLLRTRGELKLTVALSPSMATPLAKDALLPWVGKGRLELAARLEGDPVLTLTASHPAAPRPQDAVEEAVEARERLQKRLGAPPSGVVAGAGALDAPLAAGLGASGAEWVLAGPYAPAEGPWAAAGKVPLVPARPLTPVPDERWGQFGASVYDESASTFSVFLAALKALPDRARPSDGWALVGELARAPASRAEPGAMAAWPAWDPEAARVPPADPGVRASWDAYGEAAAALDRYQNSGLADLHTLEAATALLRRAQSWRLFHDAAGTQTPSPELGKRLSAVYRRLKQATPEKVGAAAAAGEGGGASAEVRAVRGAGWLEFRNPAGSPALAPAVGADAAAWKLGSLRVEWTDAAVTVILRVGGPSVAAPKPVYELYVDLNHVMGAGRTALLEAGALLPARDAWELALAILGDEARLYRAGGGAEPDAAAALKAVRSADGREVSVSVPRGLMRGSPDRWGWAVAAVAEDPARAGRPLARPDGGFVLGALSSLDAQKELLGKTGARLPACRLTP